MANVYTSLATSTTTITELSAALQSKYATNLTVLYEDATNVVFSCALLSSKIIKFTLASAKYILAYYGDSWTSGTTLVNSVSVFGYDWTAIVTANHLVCGDSFLLVNAITNGDYNNGVILIGKLTNGHSVAIGARSNNAVGMGAAFSADITLGEFVTIIGIDNGFTSETGTLFKRPVYFQRLNIGLETNTDGSLATLPGLYSASYAAGTIGATKSDAYFISASGLYSNNNYTYSMHLKSSLLAEW